MRRNDFDILLTTALPQIKQAAQRYATRYNMGDEWQDVAQDVVLRLLTYSDHYDPDKGNILQWSITMILHRLNERYNERISNPTMTDYADIALLQLRSDSDIYGDLQAAFILSNINTEARLYYEGYNLTEIAEASGLRGRNGAKWRIDTCAKRLAKLLGYDRPKGRRERVVRKNCNVNFAVSKNRRIFALR